MVPSPSPRSTSVGSGSLRRPTSMPPSPGRPRRPGPVRSRSRSGPSKGTRKAEAPRQMEEGGPDVERVFRREYGRAVSVLVRAFGDIDLAEEGVQEAFTIAAERWGADGRPPSPAGGIV